MKINILSLLYILVAALVFATCVREIDFKNDEVDKTLLVVSGGIYDSKGPFRLRLSHPTDYDKRDFEPVTGASAILTDDQGNQFVYKEIDIPDQPGWYELSDMEGVPGRSYTLEIRLSDGTAFRSRTQKMPEPLPVDSAEMRVVFLEDINSDGSIVKIPFAQVYAHTTLPDQPDGRYLRWEGEITYIFNEFDTHNPFDPPKQCFITNFISSQVVAISAPESFQPGTHLVEYAGRRSIDYSFDLRNCFSVYQRTIGKEAYEYWQRVQAVVEPTGTIFDVPPAIIPGNLENLTDPSRPALGFFEVGSSDTARIYTNRSDLPFDVIAYIQKFCSGVNPCDPNNNPKRLECCECLLIPNSMLEKPDWWE